ncbi:MAG: hypothetical protein MRK01_13875 [Candidatus Scalindua sp.]|nr:hypothetical protein [Candidatus Scalindua sp.]
MSIVTTANEINKEAFEVLFKELGVSRTIRFINQYSIGKGNYVEMKDKIFRGMTVEDIVSEIKLNSDKNTKQSHEANHQ